MKNIKHKILFADQNKELAELYKQRLELENYEVETCSDSEKTVSKIISDSPDLVVLDFSDSEFNNYEIVSSLKSDSSTKDVPIIVFTNKSNRQELMELGLDEFLLKSKTTPNELSQKIAEIISKKS